MAIDADDRPTTFDVAETAEWLEALEAVVRHDGPDRARYLLQDAFRRRTPPRAPSGRRPLDALRQHDPGRTSRTPIPGDQEIEHRLRSLVRWNAMATILQANKESSELGGHIASVPVRGHALRGRLQPLLARAVRRPRRRPHLHPGPLVAGHLRARLPRGAHRRGADEALPHRGRRRRALVLPAPVADAGLLAVPDGLDGPRPADGDLPGALHEVPRGPRPRRHREAPRLGVHGRRRDGRARVDGRDLAGRARAPRQPRLRHQLQPAAPRRPGARQRQDHPGARDELPRRRLERDQGHLGRPLGPAARRRHRRPPRAPHGGGRRRRLPDLQVARRRVRARALLRRRPRARAAWSRTGPTPTSGSSTAAATTRARSTPPTPRRSRTRASRR